MKHTRSSRKQARPKTAARPNVSRSTSHQTVPECTKANLFESINWLVSALLEREVFLIGEHNGSEVDLTSQLSANLAAAC